jgi:hypothetical protein
VTKVITCVARGSTGEIPARILNVPGRCLFFGFPLGFLAGPGTVCFAEVAILNWPILERATLASVGPPCFSY